MTILTVLAFSDQRSRIHRILQCRRPGSIPGLGKSTGEGIDPTPVFSGFPCGSAGKESACNVGDLGSVPGLGRPPGEGNGYLLQYSGLENSMDCTVHGVTKSQTRLSDFHFTSLQSVYLRLKVDLPMPGLITVPNSTGWP